MSDRGAYLRALDQEARVLVPPKSNGPSLQLSDRDGIVTDVTDQDHPEVDDIPSTNVTGRTLTVGDRVCMRVGHGKRLLYGVYPT